MNKLKNIWYIIAASCVMFSCSPTKNLKPGEVLYTGATVNINPGEKNISGAKGFKETLKSSTRPIPNKKILGIRYKLFFYNLAGEPKSDKGFRYWLRNKMGEPPVLMSDVNTASNVNILSSYMISKGFLQATADGETVVKGKTGKAIYNVYTGERYTINNIEFPSVDTSYNITRIINDNKKSTILKQGDYYDLDNFKTERSRIDNTLKEEGYYYFSPDYLIVKVDSTIGNHKADLFLNIKPTTPLAALKPYYINDINIYPNYSLQRDSSIRETTSVRYKDFNIYDPRNKYKPKLFESLIFFNSGEKYNRRDHSLTLNRLVNIGTFKFVKADFKPIDTATSNNMDVDFLLTSLRKYALTASVTGTSKSNNFVGSEIKINWINRNVFKGAELLRVGLSGGFEKQISGTPPLANSYSLGADASLIIPRFMLPIFNLKTYNAYVPKTHFTAGAQLLNRARYYTLVAGNGEFGYIWKGSELNEHVLNPVSITYVRTANTTDSFNRMLEAVPTLRRNFENQFIVGTNYTFTYSNQYQDYRRNNFLFIGRLESAGNLINLFIPKDTDGKKRLWGAITNQYFRFEGDFRNYYKVKPGNALTWASRLNIGIGLPHGNSDILPYVRQFFAGGTNDVRAFRARSLGPGSYNVNKDKIQLYADQGGDIKLLLSTELRARLYKIIHGAVFIDAGNIWLAKEDTARPGSMFKIGNVLKQTAIGGGVGLRVDAKIFVVRFDLAAPLRKPYQENGKYGTLADWNFGNKEWRQQNLILNIAIGYPF